MVLKAYSLISIGEGVFWGIVLGLLFHLSLKFALTITIISGIITFGLLCFISSANNWDSKE